MKLCSLIRILPDKYVSKYVEELETKGAGKSLQLMRLAWNNGQENTLDEQSLAKAIYHKADSKSLRNLDKLASETFSNALFFVVKYFPWFYDEVIAALKKHVLSVDKGEELQMVDDVEVVFSKLENTQHESNIYVFLYKHYYYQRDYPKAAHFQEKAKMADERNEQLKEYGKIIHEGHVARRKKNKTESAEIDRLLKQLLDMAVSPSVAVKRDAYKAYLTIVHNLAKDRDADDATEHAVKQWEKLDERNSYINTEFRDLNTAFIKQMIVSLMRNHLTENEKLKTIEWFDAVRNDANSFATNYITFRWHHCLVRSVYYEEALCLQFPDSRSTPNQKAYDLLLEVEREVSGILENQDEWQLQPGVQNHLKGFYATLKAYKGNYKEASAISEQLLHESQQMQESALSHVVYCGLICFRFFEKDFAEVIELYQKYKRFMRSDIPFIPAQQHLTTFYYLVARIQFEGFEKLSAQLTEICRQLIAGFTPSEIENKVQYVLNYFGIPISVFSQD